MIVIVGCGASKQDRPARVAELYVGQYFRECLATARACAPDDRVFILSALYGLLGLSDPAEPYNLTMGEPGSVTPVRVREQAEARGIQEEPVIVLAGGRYAAVARQVWTDVRAPLAGLGIGQQRHTMAIMRAFFDAWDLDTDAAVL